MRWCSQTFDLLVAVICLMDRLFTAHLESACHRCFFSQLHNGFFSCRGLAGPDQLVYRRRPIACREARLASAGQGGFIEIHAGSPTEKLVAKIEVTPTGDWQKWATTEAATVTDPGGTNDLFMVFKAKSGSGSGLFNLNWLHFVEK